VWRGDRSVLRIPLFSNAPVRLETHSVLSTELISVKLFGPRWSNHLRRPLFPASDLPTREKSFLLSVSRAVHPFEFTQPAAFYKEAFADAKWHNRPMLTVAFHV
jgi:hypothetical protein